MVGGEKSCLQSNPIPTRDTQRAQAKPWAHQDTETEPDQPLKCLNVSCRGKGQQWRAAGTGVLVATDLGDAACEPHHRDTKQTTHKLENNFM